MVAAGAVAEWLGRGLQSLAHRFDSGRRLLFLPDLRARHLRERVLNRCQRRRSEVLKRRWLALMLCVLVAFVAAGVSGAANTGILLDPVGDSGSAPDITRVEIEE